MEEVVCKLMTKRLRWRSLISMSLLNCTLLYWLSDTLAFPLVSMLFVFDFGWDQQQYAEELQKLDRKVLRRSEWAVQALFLLLNFKILLKKQTCYLLDRHPVYFLVGIWGLLTIFIVHALRSRVARRAVEKEENKLMIKVIVKKADLLVEVPSLSVSEKINEECAICY
jgi:hypothetical protein